MMIHAPSGATHLVDYCDRNDQSRQGFSIARTCLDAALVAVAKRSGVEVREGCRVASVGYDRGRVCEVRLATGDTVRAQLVIGADGLHSVVARAAGPPVRVIWPRRLGLVLSDLELPDLINSCVRGITLAEKRFGGRVMAKKTAGRQTSTKMGVRSLAQKAENTRHLFDPAPPARKKEGAFGQERGDKRTRREPGTELSQPGKAAALRRVR